MHFIKQIGLGLKSYSAAIRFIRENKLLYFFIFPLVLNIGLLSFGYSYVNLFSGYIENWLDVLLGLEAPENRFLGILAGLMNGVVRIFIRILFFFIYAFVGGYIVLIIMSPVLAFLSEKTEKILTNSDYPFSFEQFLKDVVRGIALAIRNFVIEMLLTLAILVLALIPVLGLPFAFLAPVIQFVITSYFYGFSFMDYTNERKKRSIKQSVQYVRRLKWLSVINGALFYACFIIPFIGGFLSGFVCIVSTVAASLALLDNSTKEVVNV